MRVITGSARGRRLRTLPGLEVRPTTDKVKEAIFSILQNDLPGARVLDLFAGSGQLGIEALSRGAREAVFVDQARQALGVIRENLEHTGLAGRARVYGAPAEAFLKGNRERFDVILLDPPYQQGHSQRLLPLLAGAAAERGVILCETAADEPMPERAGDWPIYRQYRYGKVKLTAYRPAEEGEG